MTTIRYFIPEDGDSELQPNVFLAPKPRQQGYPPTLGQIKSSFPVPGRYHFRFKSPLIPGSDRDKDAMAVWMDCVDDREVVPTWKAAIIAKVTRIGVEEDEDTEDEESSDFNAAARSTSSTISTSANAPRAVSTSSATPAASPSLDIFDSNPSMATQTPQPGRVNSTPTLNNNNHSVAHNLLDGHIHHTTSGDSLSKNGGADSLLDMGFHQHTNNSTTPAHADFFGMTATPNHHHVTSAPVSGGFNPKPAQAPVSGNFHPNQQQQYGRPQQNAFNQFNQQNAPFGDLGTPWKT